MIKEAANAMARERGLRSRTSCPHLGGMHRNCNAPPSTMKTATLSSLELSAKLAKARARLRSRVPKRARGA